LITTTEVPLWVETNLVVRVPTQTLDQILSAEPLLRELHRRAEKVKATDGFCANEVWYERFKPLLIQLVGREARRPDLRNDEAYDVVYEAIYDQLPDCQHEPNAFCI
jgi:hypothetical protein